MDTNGDWMVKSASIGASLGGVGGFFCAAYMMATIGALNWTGVFETAESVVVVFVFAVMIGSLCIAIGGLAGLVLGFATFPLSRFMVRETTRAEGATARIRAVQSERTRLS
jgi:hypothetical protein